ncbi:MAG: hypothetical protein REI11_05250, partial [Patulibacter sp.]|nr:hypothetical protein [Patulibacter sp.]
GGVLMVNVGWPRAEIYDPAGGHWLLQYSAPIFVVAALMLGGIAYLVMRNQQATGAGVIKADEVATPVTTAA